jgi:predicted amidophosphoribosyltransferase
MRCSRCGHDNRIGAKFCEECATPLARTCSNCGSQISPSAKVCPECAHPTSTEERQPRFISPESYTPQHLAEKNPHLQDGP